MAEMADEPKTDTKLLALVLMIVAGFLIALIMEATRELDRDLDWQSAVLTRGLFGTLVSVPLAWRFLPKIHAFHKTLFFRSSFAVVFLIAIFYSVSKILPADAIAITSTQPIIIAIISIFWFGSRYFFKFWVFSVLAVVGVVILVSAKTPDGMVVVGMLVAATVCRGFSIILLRFLKDIPPSIIALHFSLLVLLVGSKRWPQNSGQFVKVS
jgi:drug/metabolite transporter (DMT)-like permease